ncbi:zinc-binding dehydrogenase [Dietzia alimentaria]|uniref:zinc-binding dehydrogenase n=1 Tax=Dietzia alimentaria TaxID=665550 RepID=UPI00029B4746|nr:zinc-binding dehydrogenase [Dietzia alimentaria]
MLAASINAFGGPDVLTVGEVDTPRPGPGEVLVRVHASSTNPIDALIRLGMARPDLPMPAVLGSDIAGVVEELGPGVTDFTIGDEVYYTTQLTQGGDGYAQYNVASAAIVARKPSGLSFTEAAAIPLAGGTAWEAVVRRLAVRPGQTVLVHGGSGGVGSFAIQFAVAAGATVLSTAGPDNQEVVRSLGATPIDYSSEDFVKVVLDHTAGAGADAVLDTVGGDNVRRSLTAARGGGHIATIVPPDGQLDALYQRNQTLHGIFLSRERARLTEMTPVFEQGLARPSIGSVMPLADIVEAHRVLDSGHSRGKTVIEMP